MQLMQQQQEKVAAFAQMLSAAQADVQQRARPRREKFAGCSAQPWESIITEVAKAAAINAHVEESLSRDIWKFVQSLANGVIYQGP